MESATPGVKSTKDGWLNRYLQVAHEGETPLSAVAMTRQMPRSLQGSAPASRWAASASSASAAAWTPRLVRNGLRRRRGSGPRWDGGRCVQGDADVVVGRWTLDRIGPRMGSSIRARRSDSRSRRLLGWPRPMSGSRSHSPRAASGTVTSAKAGPPARSRTVSTTSRAASPR